MIKIIDYKQIRKDIIKRKNINEIYKKSKQLIEFDFYINSEKFDNQIRFLVKDFFNDIFKVNICEKELILLKHEITSFIRGKYYGVK